MHGFLSAIGRMMDRLDAMRVFVTALDEGSLAGAGRSPAAISRAIAFLENHVGVQLLQRTTRTMRLTDVGERYALSFQRVRLSLRKPTCRLLGSVPR
jgi:DNA-binding transcriptional LysR family regulator